MNKNATDRIAMMGAKHLSQDALQAALEDAADGDTRYQLAIRADTLSEKNWRTLLEKNMRDALELMEKRGNVPENLRVETYLKLSEEGREIHARQGLLLEPFSEQALMEVIENANRLGLHELIETGNGNGLFRNENACIALLRKVSELGGASWAQLLGGVTPGTLRKAGLDQILPLCPEDRLVSLLETHSNEVLEYTLEGLRRGEKPSKLFTEYWTGIDTTHLSDDDYFFLADKMEEGWRSAELLSPSEVEAASKEEIAQLADTIETNLAQLAALPGPRTAPLWEALGRNPNLGPDWLISEGLGIAARSGTRAAWSSQVAELLPGAPEMLPGVLKATREPVEDEYRDFQDGEPEYLLLTAASKKVNENRALWAAIQKELTNEVGFKLFTGWHWGKEALKAWIFRHEGYEKWPEVTSLTVLRAGAGGAGSGSLEVAGAWLITNLAELNPAAHRAALGLIETAEMSAEECIKLAIEIGSERKLGKAPKAPGATTAPQNKATQV